MGDEEILCHSYCTVVYCTALYYTERLRSGNVVCQFPRARAQCQKRWESVASWPKHSIVM